MQTNFGPFEGLLQGLAVVSSMKEVLSASAFRNGPWRRFVGDRGMNMKELKVDESSAVRVMMGRCPLGPPPDFLRVSSRPNPWWRMEIGMECPRAGGRRRLLGVLAFEFFRRRSFRSVEQRSSL